MKMKNPNWSILIIASLCLILLANACNTSKTVTTTVSGSSSISVTTNGFQPSMMTARVGTTVTFANNMGGPMTLVGTSGFMMGSFGGMMMQMGGSYPYTFNTPGVYVVSVSGQSIRCTITVVS
jgi:plastocyanin